MMKIKIDYFTGIDRAAGGLASLMWLRKIQVETYYSINIIYLILYMQEEAKLVVAEQFDQQKLEFIIFNNQVVGEGGFGIVKKAIRNDKPN